MMANLIQAITQTGVKNDTLQSQNRSIIFSNCIALILSGAGLLLFILVPQNHNIGGLTESLISVAIFTVPILLNRVSLYSISRLYLCWVPPFLISWAMIDGMKGIDVVPISGYTGLRIYIIATSCIPYLLMDKQNGVSFVLGILPTFLILVFNDDILDIAGVGYTTKGAPDAAYSFIQARSLIAYVIIGGSCLSLRLIVNKSDQQNHQLLEELDRKNKTILEQAAQDVSALDTKLYQKLEELKERDFVLRESQRIAKIGSWKYDIAENSIFWSDEMYNILGLDKSYELTLENTKKLFNDQVNRSIAMAYNNTLGGVREALDITFPIITPLGYKKWLRINGFTSYKNETISGATGICHDITFFKEAEERIAIQEKKYQLLFEQASDAIIVTDLKGNFVDVNTSLCKMVGYTKEQLLQLNVGDIIDPAQMEEYSVRLKDLNEGLQIVNEWFFVRSDGSKTPVESSVKKFGGNALFGIARDISERKKIERKLTRHIEALAVLNRVNAILSKAKDVNDLFNHVCKTLVQEESYSLVWIARQSSELELDLPPLAMAGDSLAYMTTIDVNTTDQTGGIIASALRSNKPQVLNQTSSSPNYDRWLTHALPYGLHSAMSGCINVAPGERYVVNIYSSNTDSFDADEVSALQTMSENICTTIRSIHAAKERDIANYQLNERVKELSTVQMISQLLNKDDQFIDDMLTKIVHILPPGWQYPEITAARISIDEKEFKTANFTEVVDKQSADFHLPQGMKGTIDVVYLQRKPTEAEGPFLVEERNLINLIAEMLRIYFAKRHESLALKKSEAKLRAIINNTDILIWSVDSELNFTSFNKPFFDHMKNYNIEVSVGSKAVSQRVNDPQLQKKWFEFYQTGLSGKSMKAEENRFGIDFHYSLAPITEENRVVGVNVFATNITGQKQRATELAEANKQIGELKLMALRSVMNPHFIFNALNSIQFFIAANDRLNAINYLSKFSKLIRRILTSSVNNKTKLSSEIEILKNYVELEMVRFEGKFEFKLEIDPTLDADSIEIPSLLIQPYVENAILHGLYNKKDKGFLQIRIYERKDCVVFEIEDDGVGRIVASKIRERNRSTHASMGTKLTEERLKLINESQNVSFQTTDRLEGHENPGTKVTIWIKV